MTAGPGALAPLSSRPFALLWSAGVISSIGTWMNSTASAWLMTELSPSPLMVSAVQAASNLPLFLFALLAGVLADRFDRRRILLIGQSLLLVTAGLFALLVWQGLITAPLLLAFTFLMATGAAFLGPAWQATVPMLVDRPLLPQAVALNSVGLNIARAIGPAFAGVLIAGVGIAAPFAVDTLSFLAVIAALLLWHPAPRPGTAVPPEPMLEALPAGLRFTAASPQLKATLVRAVAYFLFASAFWALLPISAREAGGGPSTYGLLLGCVGTGAVVGGILLPPLKRRMPASRLMAAGTALTAGAHLLLALDQGLWIAAVSCLAMGLGWIVALSTLNVSAQMSLPDWIRARGLAVFTTCFFGAMTAGSMGWGAAASLAGTTGALAGAAAGMVLAAMAVRRLPLVSGEDAPDHTPSSHWPAPIVSAEPDADSGPVLVQIRYSIRDEDRAPFLQAMQELAGARRRGGAVRWALHEDAATPGSFLESFEEPSWTAHLRHHERVSNADRVLQEAVWRLHTGPQPKAEHFLPPGGGGT